MKTIILAGGLGSRLGEYTEAIPKPMVPVGPKPILWHIMQRYAAFGYKDFHLALGYKAAVIKDYFLNYATLNADFSISLADKSVDMLSKVKEDWRVSLHDTGVGTMTGGRLKRLKSYIGNETFMLTYGDGVADIDIDALVSFHKSHGKIVTVSAVHPSARFGELAMDGDMVTSFQEKPQTSAGWINGGYFVIEPAFFDLIDNDDTVLEEAPLERAAKAGEMCAFRHDGFWQCMDTKRDKDKLDALWNAGNAPWLAA
jgi:glucose-1-phosphate cytidylyltransferase